MPWVWTSPKQHLELEVFKDEPWDKGVYTYCPWCKGWIEGFPIQEHEDTMGPLSGRCGTVSYCRRCGHEIDFFGSIS